MWLSNTSDISNMQFILFFKALIFGIEAQCGCIVLEIFATTNSPRQIVHIAVKLFNYITILISTHACGDRTAQSVVITNASKITVLISEQLKHTESLLRHSEL